MKQYHRITIKKKIKKLTKNLKKKINPRVNFFITKRWFKIEIHTEKHCLKLSKIFILIILNLNKKLK